MDQNTVKMSCKEYGNPAVNVFYKYIIEGNYEKLEEHIKQGFKICSSCCKLAHERHGWQMVKMFLDNNPDSVVVKLGLEVDPLLMTYIRENNFEAVKYFLDRGTDPTKFLLLALKHTYGPISVNIIRLLIDYGADVNQLEPPSVIGLGANANQLEHPVIGLGPNANRLQHPVIGLGPNANQLEPPVIGLGPNANQLEHPVLNVGPNANQLEHPVIGLGPNANRLQHPVIGLGPNANQLEPPVIGLGPNANQLEHPVLNVGPNANQLEHPVIGLGPNANRLQHPVIGLGPNANQLEPPVIGLGPNANQLEHPVIGLGPNANRLQHPVIGLGPNANQLEPPVIGLGPNANQLEHPVLNVGPNANQLEHPVIGLGPNANRLQHPVIGLGPNANQLEHPVLNVGPNANQLEHPVIGLGPNANRLQHPVIGLGPNANQLEPPVIGLGPNANQLEHPVLNVGPNANQLEHPVIGLGPNANRLQRRIFEGSPKHALWHAIQNKQFYKREMFEVFVEASGHRICNESNYFIGQAVMKYTGHLQSELTSPKNSTITIVEEGGVSYVNSVRMDPFAEKMTQFRQEKTEALEYLLQFIPQHENDYIDPQTTYLRCWSIAHMYDIPEVFLSPAIKQINRISIEPLYLGTRLQHGEFVYQDINCSPISLFIHYIDRSGTHRDGGTPKKAILKGLRLLLENGFKVDEPNCVSPLTLMIIKFRRRSGMLPLKNSLFKYVTEGEQIGREPESEVIELTNFLIQNGAHVSQSNFVFRFLRPNLDVLRQNLLLPDVVYAAFESVSLSCLQMLLPYFAQPPLALLLWTSSHCDRFLVNVTFPILCEGGPIPPGSSYLDGLKTHMEIIFNHRGIDHNYSKFVEMHSSPPSLKHLCRCFIRATCAEKASQPGERLPELMRSFEIPEELQDYLAMTPPQLLDVFYCEDPIMARIANATITRLSKFGRRIFN